MANTAATQTPPVFFWNTSQPWAESGRLCSGCGGLHCVYVCAVSVLEVFFFPANDSSCFTSSKAAIFFLLLIGGSTVWGGSEVLQSHSQIYLLCSGVGTSSIMTFTFLHGEMLQSFWNSNELDCPLMKGDSTSPLYMWPVLFKYVYNCRYIDILIKKNTKCSISHVEERQVKLYVGVCDDSIWELQAVSPFSLLFFDPPSQCCLSLSGFSHWLRWRIRKLLCPCSLQLPHFIIPFSFISVSLTLPLFLASSLPSTIVAPLPFPDLTACE